jgi:molybdate transport system substrate-binding protein
MLSKTCLSLLAVFFAATVSGPCLADTLRVAVASNFAPVLQQLAPAFEALSGHTVSASPGSTGRHYTQITNGAPFDVFLAADSERPVMLEQEQRALAGSRFTYALGRIMLWSPQPGLVDAEGLVLQTGSFRHLAIANPRLAPYGLAAREILGQLQLWDRLQDRLVQGENIAQTLQFVQSGNAELGFIALSQWLDLADRQTGSSWEPPMALYSPIAQQAVILRDSAAARQFMDFLRSSEARTVIINAGYGLP